MPVLSGKVKWASIQQPNTKFTPQWSIDVILDVDTAKRLKAEGYNVKKNDEGEIFIKVKRNVHRKDGTTNSPPRVVDANKQAFSELVGNGSVCNVQYTSFPWNYAGRSGLGANLVAVQVLEHVPFTADEFEVVGDGSSGNRDNRSNDDDFDDDIPF